MVPLELMVGECARAVGPFPSREYNESEYNESQIGVGLISCGGGLDDRVNI